MKPMTASPARRRPSIVLASILSLLAVVSASCSKEAAPPPRPAPQVSVVTITPTTIPYTPTFVAQTESSRQVNIVARVSGFLDEIAYQEGALVKQGQLMFQLDPKPFQAKLNAAKGELQAQQARLATAKANYGRVKPLADQDALSQADLDRARGDLDSATAAVFSATAKVEQADLDRSYATIRSPVTGVAGQSLQRQGAFVNSMSDSANLTYVAAIDPIWVNFSISQNQIARFNAMTEKGQLTRPSDQSFEIEIVLPGGAVYPHHGKIDFADPSFSQDTGSFLVRAVLPNPKAELSPGMFVTAIVKGSSRPDAIVVPQLAVQQGSNGHLVYVVNQKNVVEVRPVIVGDYQGDKDIVILNGLHKDDRVVVDGVLKVVPGKPVTLAPPKATPPVPASATAPKE
ncbi:MAG TPA: efflux RND transporter periplasmic adaptor subunit [Burkholderiales bacterium]